VPSRNKAPNSALKIVSRSGGSQRGWHVTSSVWYSPDMMKGVVVHLALYSSGVSEVCELGKESVDRCATTDDLDAED
jgi:hypothetical protein